MTSPPLPQLQTTLTSLTTAVHILDLFAHRNKNQHRGTKWWGAFDRLRRNLHRLLPDLKGAVQRAEVLGFASAASTKKRIKTLTADGEGAATRMKQMKQPELDKVVDRVAWMRSAVVPRAFAAFTQLTTDKQFAQLGLVLIGVLAQVEAAIKPFTPGDPEPENDEGVAPGQPTRDEADTQGKTVSRAVIPIADDGGGGFNGLDLGEAVARDEFEGDDSDDKMERTQPSAERGSSALPQPPFQKKIQREMMKTKKRKMQKEVEEGSSRMEMTKSQLTKTNEVKSVKKKKKRKGGDEFDSLFSSLL